MKTAITTAIAASALICSAASAQIAIDTSVFFAYAAVESTYIFLSKEPCADAEARKYGWKRAAYYYPNHNDPYPGCWKTHQGGTVSDMRICRSTMDGEMGNACVPASMSRFTDTKSLPSRARF